MKTLLFSQGSTEWNMARAGVITASEIDALITPKFEARTGEGVKTYLYRKASERIMGYSGESGGGGSFAMEQGNILEKIAIPWYEFRRNVSVTRVGFCVSDDSKIGCSPDGLVGDLLGLEIKCPTPPTHCKYLIEQRVPPEYLPQVHMSMFVTGRPEWEFVSYSPFLPALVVRVLRDEGIQKAIGETLAKFIPMLDEAENRIRQMMPKQSRDN